MKVFLIAALTADGLIARSSEDISTSWTSKEDKAWFNQTTKKAGIMVMGRTTFATVGRALPDRQTVVLTSNPEQLIAENPTFVHPLSELPTTVLGPQESRVYATNLPVENLILQLSDKKYSEVAICGGTSVYTAFAQAKLLTDLYLTVEPVVFGKGLGLFNDLVLLNIHLEEVLPLSEQTVVLHYRVTPQ